MGLFKNDAPPAPNYTPLIQAQTDAASKANDIATQNLQLGKDQLAWAKDQYAKDYALISPLVQKQGAIQDQFSNYATADRQNYENNFLPVQKQYIQDAQTYDSPDRLNAAAGAAEGTVASQYEQARQAATRNLESYGVDPTSTRYAALDIGARTQQAAAAAGAGNNAIRDTRNTALNMRANVANMGMGVNNQAMQEAGVANTSANSAVGNTLATTQSGSQTMGTPTSWASLGNGALQTGNSALQGAVNTTNTQYQNQLDRTKLNNQSSSGIGSMIGTVAGIAAAPFTGGMSLALPGLLGALGGGSSSPGVGATYGGYASGNTSGYGSYGGVSYPAFADGGAVPATMSPSHGAVTDDVPATINGAIPARLNAGEFVIPRDVVAWEGQKGIQALIAKARKQMQSGQAAPSQQQQPMRAVG